MGWRVGVDSGGTFTDVCLFEAESGRIEVWKVPSTPRDPSRGIIDSLAESLGRQGATPAEVAYFGHGTTVATNALIEEKGVLTGLITTLGFRDLLEIGRQRRPDLYDLQADKPATLVSRDLRLEVPERVRHDGSVEKKLDEAAVRRAVALLKARGVKAVAISFLYGFVRPEHEEIARRIIVEEFPEAFVSTGSEVAPEFREYERMSTAVVNAYLGPVMQGYIERLEKRLEDAGVPATPHLTQSNGGVAGFTQAARLPVTTLLSGPSTGVVAAEAVGRIAGSTNLITFDMGGTSTDVALLEGGRCGLANEASVHGHPVKAPMLDINTVGAGGGSIAYIDSGEHLKVGPRSAGADPGPVCYGRGNTEPTVTDANVLLQALNPSHLLGGRMAVRRDLAEHAISRLAARLGMDRFAAASGILAVVTANMAKAIRVISVQRGHDPRDYTLVAFGGAGPLHAARLARELEIGRILVPRNPGILCAMGLLLTDLRKDFASTRLLALADRALPAMAEAFARLEQRAREWLDSEGVTEEARLLARSVDMRYAGQNYELPVPLEPGLAQSAWIERLAQGFRRAHERSYGFAAAEEPVQMVTFRLQAGGKVPKATLRSYPEGGADAAAARLGEREIWFAEAGDFLRCPIYDRERLRPGNRITGPAVIEQMDATTLLLPGMDARVDSILNLALAFA
ncbi:MAG: hydantoinase/oxoprolinase family protein [Acetobacteraceae bacterium]